ncbi:MAG TPA: hypothetical protein VF756_18670 [Thermoanaerobaculia bacterium]
MPKEKSKVGRLGEMKHFSATLEANSADLAHVEVSRTAFADVVTRAEEVVRQQAAFAAAKQQASQELMPSSGRASASPPCSASR